MIRPLPLFLIFKAICNLKTPLNIIIIPGEIFGTKGKYNFRVSGLGSVDNSKKAVERIKEYYEKNI